ncbi:type IV secretion system protein VirB10 [Povalibacter sp.]|uniref:type IV secretion system protein VirB10 n=1 Tax=Povalibacter sp. TaxID=1962978 RepID=UPI002F408EB7
MNPSDPVGNEPAQEPVEQSVDDSTVAGERGIPSVNRARSLQSRVSNALAMGLMGSLGLGLLTWYFANMSARHARVEASARSSGEDKAKTEMVLPALGPAMPAPMIERVLGPVPELPEHEPFDSDAFGGATSVGPASAPGTAKSPEAQALERRLSGPVFVAVQGGAQGSSGYSGSNAMGVERGEEPDDPQGMQAWLAPTVTPAAVAGVLPTSRLLLPKGSFVDCTLETALDSTLPGMATCVTASDTFGADGKVVLLERGTKLVGETRGSVRQGQARIFVLWTQARTPTGVLVELASPGTDELGRSGLPGEVDRHFVERFGAAMLISLIDGIVQSAVQDSMGGATVIYNPSTSQDILTEVLRSTVSIPPTVRKAQGDRIQVLVARDLDFRSVYRLRAVSRDDAGGGHGFGE